MRILDQYITRQFIMPFLTCLFIFYFLFIIGDLLGHLDDFSEKQVSFTVLFQYYAAWIPIIFVRTCPIAIVLSTLFTLGILNKNNEITGMKAGGISLFRIVFPFLFSALILSFIVLIVNDYYVPKAEFTTTKTKEEKIEKKGALSQEIIENVTLHGTNNKIYVAQKYDVSKKILYMLTITQQDNLKRVHVKMRADKACWEDKTKQWRFYNLLTEHLDEKGQTT
ncbi:MAG: LptF/LptG family permease, partial [Candidatus Omnitrophica bacterium]|nr:LptF/LptG family permease [Candidatus Omnitrophota bacterium]